MCIEVERLSCLHSRGLSEGGGYRICNRE